MLSEWGTSYEEYGDPWEGDEYLAVRGASPTWTATVKAHIDVNDATTTAADVTSCTARGRWSIG